MLFEKFRHTKAFILPHALCMFLIFSCSEKDAIQEVLNPTLTKHIGFNMRWGDTPIITEKLTTTISRMQPTMLRYPGGTMAHNFNWETGLPSSHSDKDVVHKIEDVKRMADATDTDIVFVLDIVHSTIENQLEMLKASNVPVLYVEIGNELYSDHYEEIFPTGKAYADTINNWIPRIEKEFPTAKFGVSMIGREAGNERKTNWNSDVYANITTNVDALVYHLYVRDDESVQDRIHRFLHILLKTKQKNYGLQNMVLIVNP
ncbi:MAG: hypothetical protein P8L42_03705 [Flavicella sp.]|nr:hypothetical protein [Flavicella sp.]